MKTVLIAVLIAGACAQRLENVVVAPGLPRQHTVSMRYLYGHSVSNTGAIGWGAPLEAQYQLPMSARTVYIFYRAPAGTPIQSVEDIHDPRNTGARVVAGAAAGNALTINTVRLDFDRTNPQRDTVFIRYQQPNLDINPFGCGSSDVTGNCRCRLDTGLQAYLDITDPQFQQTAPIVGSTSTFVPNIQSNYFEHAPYAGQNPYLRTFRRLCVQTGTAAAGPVETNWFDTQVFIGVVLPCFNPNTPPAFATNAVRDFNCASRATSQIGVAGGAVLTATNAGILGDFVRAAASTQNDLAAGFGETTTMTNDRFTRTTCCGSSDADTATGLVVQPGICINRARTSCCGRRPFQPLEEQCCDRRSSSVRHVTQACPCLTVTEDTQQCQRNAANIFDAQGKDQGGLTQGTSSTDFCCGVTKFGGPEQQIQQFSFCVSRDPNAVRKCCNDGNVYDSSSQQCCPINGVQSLNLPCPCGAQSDCPNPARQACCTQLFPIPSPRDQINTLQCNRFAAYPRYSSRIGGGDDVLDTPPVPREALRCAGSCYSLDYQICCNGRVCSSALERCCNDTCCNRYTSGCVDGRRAGGLTRTNPRDWSVYYETCASTGALNGRKAFFVFILPTFMLFVTLLSLALVTVLARRATEHIFELTERILVGISVIETLLCCAFYFSPLYKNTVAVAFVSLATILIAVARKTHASIFGIFLTLFMVLYLVDPFDGNIWLGVTSNIPVRSAPSASSLPIAVALMALLPTQTCTPYYNNWFAVDTTLVDTARHYNPQEGTWGFCSWPWLTTLAIFSILLVVGMLLMLLLSVFSLIKKIGVKQVEPIELEIVPEPDVFAPAPLQTPFY